MCVCMYICMYLVCLYVYEFPLKPFTSERAPAVVRDILECKRLVAAFIFPLNLKLNRICSSLGYAKW